MQTYQSCFVNGKWQAVAGQNSINESAVNLVLVFGQGALVSNAVIYADIAAKFPNATIILGSTSGEIIGEEVLDDTLSLTAIIFEKTVLQSIETQVQLHANSYDAGVFLMQELQNKGTDLKTVFVLSDGTFINGSELVSGMNAANTNDILISGGLAADAANFATTYTGLNKPATPGNVIAIGLYGNNIEVGHGSFGGWDEFGKERVITKSDKNILYELDGHNALQLYKEYLGPYADELPGSALLFPLSIQLEGYDKKLVRTILTIDQEKGSMTFAGNLPEGSKVRLMKANFDKLIEASSVAAQHSQLNNQTQLAILISCVGRKLILQERTFEEVKAAANILGEQTTICGFYSYGEISPFNKGVSCELHNQTMTITTLREI